MPDPIVDERVRIATLQEAQYYQIFRNEDPLLDQDLFAKHAQKSA